MTDNQQPAPNYGDERLTFVSQQEPESQPPPRLETGVLLWIRKNLFGSALSTILTIVGFLLIVVSLVGTTTWIVQEANWFAISFNFRLFMLGRFEAQYEWRTTATLLFSVFAMGAAIAVWVKQIARTMVVTVIVLLVIVLALPQMINATLSLPSFYTTVGATEIVSGTTTEIPQSQVAFVARAGEEIEMRFANHLVESEESLASTAGFVDRATNALRNAAQNHLDQLAAQAEREALLAEDAASDIPILTANQREQAEQAVANFEAPDPTLETYNVNEAGVAITIRDGQTLEPIAETRTLISPDDVLTFEIPEDGWFILEKTLVGDVPETTVSILDIHGIYPVLQSNSFDPEQSTFVDTYIRVTDFYRTAERLPEIDGEDAEFVVVTRNQYRGERSLADYLRAYVSPFLNRVGTDFAIMMLVSVAGYWLTVFVGNTYSKSTATNLTAYLLAFIPILFWVLVNGMYAYTAVTWLMVIGVLLIAQLAFKLGQRNGWSPLVIAISLVVYAGVVGVLLVTEGFDLPELLGLRLAIEPAGVPRFILWLSILVIGGGAISGINLYIPGDEDQVKVNWLFHGLLGLILLLIGAGILVSNTVTLETIWPLQPSDPRGWGGLLLTMALTIYGIIIAFPIGIGLALGRRSDLPAIKYLCTGYIELVRGSPFITVLFFMQLLIPLLNEDLAAVSNTYRALVATIAFSAAYLAENVRGGLQSLPPGQEEAAKALGLSGWQTITLITLPQALRAVIPALVGQFISLFKDTSLVAIVGLTDLVGVVNTMSVQTEFIGTRLEGLFFISIIYFVFSYVMSYVSRLLEASGSGSTRRM